jgi:hypothetical protein
VKRTYIEQCTNIPVSALLQSEKITAIDKKVEETVVVIKKAEVEIESAAVYDAWYKRYKIYLIAGSALVVLLIIIIVAAKLASKK